jgi:hypothetical protein
MPAKQQESVFVGADRFSIYQRTGLLAERQTTIIRVTGRDSQADVRIRYFLEEFI